MINMCLNQSRRRVMPGIFRQAGQGLVETLMIFLFIGVSVVALIKYEHNLNYSSAVATETSNAILVTLNEIEVLRNYSVVNTTSGYVAYAGIASGTGTSTMGNITYNLTWTVTTNASPVYKTLNVTTSWNDTYGTAHSVSIDTMVTDSDPSTASSFM